MVLGWMLYCAAVSTLLAGAAMLLEEAGRRTGLQVRWIWSTAMAASLLIPIWAFLRPRADALPVEALTPGLVSIGEVTALARRAPIAAGASMPLLDPLLLGAWGGASAVLLLMAGWSLHRIRGARARWEDATVEGQPVLVSAVTGPAVVGWVRPAIVFPRWVLERPAAERALILRHEQEHLRARDPLVLLMAGITAVLLPWNPALWWQLRRLRLAIELDCDARVVRRGGDLREYASLLIEVGRRRAGGGSPLLALAEPASFLEQRIRRMTLRRGRWGAGIATASAVAGVALVAGACSIEEPPAITASAPTESAATMEPRDTDPRLLDPAAFMRSLERVYPAALRDAGIGGRVQLWLFVDEQGMTAQTRVRETSGYAELDSAAVRVAREARFSPAIDQGSPVAAWISVPVTFRTTDTPPPAREAGASPQEPAAAVQNDTPSPRDSPQRTPAPGDPAPDTIPEFVPREVGPQLQDVSGFQQLLERVYPPALRDAGIGGRAMLWLYVDEEGRTTDPRIQESSGHPQLDSAAVLAIRQARFSPAMDRGNPIPVWIAIPITFHSSSRPD